MTGSECIFWTEVKAKRANSRSLKLCYAILMTQHSGDGADFWPAIHDALRSRLDLSTPKKLDNFKCEAWAIYEAIAATQKAA
ncbi:hypothetical protein [Mesorhizobium sp. DCY119]|uniref:hypothetical protein n=1 Tax=Mesorhizobium sp. DCY119 TaxID=2108445 RepID=UPI000E6B966F|nr:hypothetical protein [Mesorhizobium sp. DCY119]RJG46530.1 hypothetical protein D3Y55_21285 [Mesorhizobium sp. DCY119]